MESKRRKMSEGSTSTIPMKTKIKDFFKNNLLLVLIVAGVLLGFIIGVIAYEPVQNLEGDRKRETIMLISYPGELFMRMLKLIILPLIVASLITAVATLPNTGMLGKRVVLFYLTTTVIASITGIIFVSIFHPGKNTYQYKVLKKDHMTMLDAFLDLIRNCFPNNIVAAAFQQTKTKFKSVTTHSPVNLTMITNATERAKFIAKNNVVFRSDGNFTEHSHYEWDHVGTTSGLNVLGIVVFSIAFGKILNNMGDKATHLTNFFTCLNDAVMNLVWTIMWAAPVGIGSLICGKVVGMEDVANLLEMLGLFMATVICGLAFHALVVLPVMMLFLARRNPFKYAFGMSEAFATAFGIASSSATLPVTIKCVEEKNGVDPRVARFILPLGATVNMDGTALYEAVSCLFIAQMRGVDMNAADIVTTVLTATLASIGAAGIPHAGLVTMVIVLQAVGLPIDDIGLIFAVDWLLDRFRTAVNVWGDSVGAGIVAYMCRDKLADDILPLKNKQDQQDDRDSLPPDATDRRQKDDVESGLENRTAPQKQSYDNSFIINEPGRERPTIRGDKAIDEPSQDQQRNDIKLGLIKRDQAPQKQSYDNPTISPEPGRESPTILGDEDWSKTYV